MIQEPAGDQVKFLIPELIEEIDPLAEPTVENSTAEDVLQDAVADGGVLVNAWDGRPLFRPKIHTGNRAINGTFDADTDWTKGADWFISGGTANATAPGAPSDLVQPGRLIIGVVYEVTFTLSDFIADTVQPLMGTGAGTARGANGTFTEDITCAGNTSIIFRANTNAEMKIDNVIVRPKSLWRIDTELQRRAEKQLDFAMVVTQNLHEVYQVSCENCLRFFQNTSDALPTDPLETTKTLYGLLGKPWPFISLDGVNDVGTISDDPDLDFGIGNGTIIMRINMPDVSGAVFFYGRRQDANNQINFRFDGTQLIANMDVGGVTLHDARANWAPVADTWYLIAWSFVNGTSNLLTVAGVTQPLATDTKTGGDMSIAADLLFGKFSTAFYKYKMGGFWQFNRALSVAEILAYSNGGVVPAADRYGSQSTNLVTNPEMTTDVSGWIAVNVTLSRVDSGADPGASSTAAGAVDDFCLKMVDAGGGTSVREEIPVEISSKYRFSYLYYNPTGGADNGLAEVYDATGAKQGSVLATTTLSGVFDAWAAQVAELTATTALAVPTFTPDTNLNNITYIDRIRFDKLGAVLALEPDGLNSVFGKWFDKANQHHATLSGVDYWHVPDADNPAFFLQAFEAFNSRFLFTQFNELLEAGQADTRLGYIIYGQMYGFQSTDQSGIAIAQGGYQASKNWPGVRIGVTDTGIILAEQKFGERPSWNITLLAQNTAGWETIQDLLQRISGPLYPFYIIWDYSHVRPVVWQVRLDPEVPFTYVTGSAPWQGITFGVTAE